MGLFTQNLVIGPKQYKPFLVKGPKKENTKVNITQGPEGRN